MTDVLSQLAARLAARCEAYECFAVSRREVSAQFQAGRLKSAQTSSRGGWGVRVGAGAKLASAGTSDPAAIAGMADSAIEAAAFGDAMTFAFAPARQATGVDTFDPAVTALRAADLAAAGEHVLARLGELGASVTADVSVGAGESRFAFVNSAGQHVEHASTEHRVSVSIESFNQDDIFSLWDSRESCTSRLALDEMLDGLRTRLELARTLADAPAAGCPVILTPEAMSGLLVPLMAGLNGQNVADGVSPLANKRGGPAILDDKLTLVDDPTLPHRPASMPVDDEGTPARRTTLIERGGVTEFLLDLRSAADLGLSSTGHASRGLARPPAPSETNLLLLPGDTPLSRMVGALDDGLLIESLLGVGQGNVNAGDYSTPIGLAFRVQGGRIIGRVKNLLLAGNVYRDLARVAAIEDRAHWHGSACLPHVRLDGLNVS